MGMQPGVHIFLEAAFMDHHPRTHCDLEQAQRFQRGNLKPQVLSPAAVRHLATAGILLVDKSQPGGRRKHLHVGVMYLALQHL